MYHFQDDLIAQDLLKMLYVQILIYHPLPEYSAKKKKNLAEYSKIKREALEQCSLTARQAKQIIT